MAGTGVVPGWVAVEDGLPADVCRLPSAVALLSSLSDPHPVSMTDTQARVTKAVVCLAERMPMIFQVSE